MRKLWLAGISVAGFVVVAWGCTGGPGSLAWNLPGRDSVDPGRDPLGAVRDPIVELGRIPPPSGDPGAGGSCVQCRNYSCTATVNGVTKSEDFEIKPENGVCTAAMLRCPVEFTIPTTTTNTPAGQGGQGQRDQTEPPVTVVIQGGPNGSFTITTPAGTVNCVPSDKPPPVVEPAPVDQVDAGSTVRRDSGTVVVPPDAG